MLAETSVKVFLKKANQTNTECIGRKSDAGNLDLPNNRAIAQAFAQLERLKSGAN